ncbi:hypothetical protein X777_10621 [Ooceraea biroi]|nr:hypothetical protein X777_10621 [Ooceraea biroi]
MHQTSASRSRTRSSRSPFSINGPARVRTPFSLDVDPLKIACQSDLSSIDDYYTTASTTSKGDLDLQSRCRPLPAGDATCYGCDALLFRIAKHRVNRAIDRRNSCSFLLSIYRAPELALFGVNIRSTAIFESPRDCKHISTLETSLRGDPCDRNPNALISDITDARRVITHAYFLIHSAHRDGLSACRLCGERERELSGAPRVS